MKTNIRPMSVEITLRQRDIVKRFAQQTGINMSTILGQGALLFMLDHINRVTDDYRLLREELLEAWYGES